MQLFFREPLKGALVLLLPLILICSIAELASAQEGSARVWKSGKHEVRGMLLRHDETHVTLMPENRKKSVKVEIAMLSDEDQLFLKGLPFIEADQVQHETVMPHMARYTESPMAVAEILNQVGKNHEKSPYAKMMVGLALATEIANYRDAKKNFEAALKIIRKHQKVLGEGYHARTVVSLQNNIAVCALKMSKGDEAAEQLSDGSSGEIPFALYHNATLLMEATKGVSQIKLTNKWRGKLVDVLAKKKPASPGVEVPSRYLFSLEWDDPLNESQLSQLVALSGKPLPHAEDKANLVGGSVFTNETELIKRGYSEHASSSGCLISPTLMLTNRHIAKSKTNDFSYTLTRFLKDGSPELVGGKVVKWSVVNGEDLALIELDKPIEDAAAFPLRRGRLNDGEDLTVLGFPDVSGEGEHISATSGRFVGMDESLPWMYSTNMMQEGIGGGPTLDMKGNLVGLAFAKSDFRNGRVVWFNNHRIERRYNDHTVTVSGKAILEFLKVALPDYEFDRESNKFYESRQALAEAVRGSVMLVKAWQPPKENVKKVRPDFVPGQSAEGFRHNWKKGEAELGSLRKKRLFPDLWCMTCYGKGRLFCLNCGGEGKIYRKESVKAGKNSLGVQMYKFEVKSSRCKACSSRPNRDCPDCEDGKLPFSIPD